MNNAARGREEQSELPGAGTVRSGSGAEKENSAQSPGREIALPQRNGWRSS